jgi:multidrug resistance efflux pump
VSPEALQAAIDALEAELDAARSWESSATANRDAARSLLERAEYSVQEAAGSVRAIEEALAHLRGLQGPQTGAQGRDEAVGGALEDGAA